MKYYKDKMFCSADCLNYTCHRHFNQVQSDEQENVALMDFSMAELLDLQCTLFIPKEEVADVS